MLWQTWHGQNTRTVHDQGGADKACIPVCAFHRPLAVRVAAKRQTLRNPDNKLGRIYGPALRKLIGFTKTQRVEHLSSGNRQFPNIRASACACRGVSVQALALAGECSCKRLRLQGVGLITPSTLIFQGDRSRGDPGGRERAQGSDRPGMK